ncbi:MAG: sulfite exporter TauE/SafE family protein [Armatimonadota bacterium]|nr:sulfite exporter TauE/SafE family protein [Armatimonadota bacterium]
MSPETLLSLELGAVALVAGALGAMLGIGGGIILVPIFIALLSIDTPVARSASLVAVCVTSLAASLVYIKQGVTDIERGAVLQFPTVVGAIIGAIVGSGIDPVIMQLIFAVLVLVIGFKMFAKDVKTESPTRRDWLLTILGCLVGGFISSLLGVGGGVFFVPILALIIGLPQRTAAATSTFLIGLTAATSALIYFRQGQMDLAVTIPAAIGILIGAQVGARASKHIPNLWLRRTFAVVKFGTAGLLLKGVFASWLR